MMTPIRLTSAVKDYIWGGERLKSLYGIGLECDKAAEGWVLSCHEEAFSLVAEGEFKGQSLLEVAEKTGWKRLFGTKCPKGNFPVLVKLIDAKRDLSVQVHPDDAFAREQGQQNGKTELWYVVDCSEGAFIYLGFKRKTSGDELLRYIERGCVTELLNKITVKRGDSFLVRARTVHALGAGCLVAEVQQSSNVTYRVFDYNRVGADGKKRELHLDKAVRVLDFEQSEIPRFEGLAGECEYFKVLSFKPHSRFEANKESFAHVLCLEGDGALLCGGTNLAIKAGDSVFIPAGSGEFFVTGGAGGLVTTL